MTVKYKDVPNVSFHGEGIINKNFVKNEWAEMYQSLSFDSRKGEVLSLGRHIETDRGIHAVSYIKRASGLKRFESEAERGRDILPLY
jgi:hypothetical protein